MKRYYNVVSKATKINENTGAEIPKEIFSGPFEIVGHDKENFYMLHTNNGNYYPEGVEGCNENVPQITGFSKAVYKVIEI